MRRGAPRAVAAPLVAALALAGCAAPSPSAVTGQPSTSINVPLQVVACTTRDVCAAFGTSLLPVGPTSTAEFRRASGDWVALRSPDAPHSYVTAAACGAAACLVGGVGPSGDLLWRFTASPTRVRALAGPLGGAEVEALACRAAACALVDSAGPGAALRFLTTSDAGAHWSTPFAIPGTEGWRATGLACPSALACLLSLSATVAPAGSTPSARLLVTTDGAITWSARRLPGAWHGLSSLTCSARGCDAVATSLGGTLWAASAPLGRRWTARPVRARVTALACTPERRCVLVGATARGPWVATTAGSAPSVSRTRYLPTPLTAAACGASLCAMAADSTVATVRP